MIKLVLCTALCCCTFLSSCELHRRKQLEAEAARELSDIVGRVISLLRFEAADVFGICGSAFENAKILDYSAFISITRGDFHALWHGACQNLRTDDYSRKLFDSVGQILGSCDVISQTDRLTQIQAELSEHSKLLREKADSTRKLYTTLGALLGLGISIVII